MDDLRKRLLSRLRQIPQPTIFGIIIVQVIIFLMGDIFRLQFDSFAVVPANITQAASQILQGDDVLAHLPTLGTLVTALFLHGSFDHILMNMVFLWTFGSLCAENLGKWNAVWIFFVTGVAGNLAQVALAPDNEGSVIGASGAVMGFEGIYVGLMVRWRLNWPHVWPLAHPVPPMQLGIFALVGVGLDVYRLMQQEPAGIAFGAHLGGFVSGFLIALAFTLIWRTKDQFSRMHSKSTGWRGNGV